MSQIKLVSFCNIYNYTKEALAHFASLLYEQDKYYVPLIQANPDYINRFKSQFVDLMVPDTYYQFILVTQKTDFPKQYADEKSQLEIFWDQANEHDLKKYLVWESQDIVNHNYEAQGPRLRALMFYYPGDK